MSNLAYETARAVEDLMCGVVEVRVGTGYPLVEFEQTAFVGITFLDSDGQTLTIALTDAQAEKLLTDFSASLALRRSHDR